jgi:hypothetical protein
MPQTLEPWIRRRKGGMGYAVGIGSTILYTGPLHEARGYLDKLNQQRRRQ